MQMGRVSFKIQYLIGYKVIMNFILKTLLGKSQQYHGIGQEGDTVDTGDICAKSDAQIGLAFKFV